MSVTSKLHEALLDAGLPALSVSIGRSNDRSTWKASGLSPQEEVQARAIIDSFDVAKAQETDTALSNLAATDIEMGRVLEDLIEVLTAKGIIGKNDLPAEAVAVLDMRKEERGKL